MRSLPTGSCVVQMVSLLPSVLEIISSILCDFNFEYTLVHLFFKTRNMEHLHSGKVKGAPLAALRPVLLLPLRNTRLSVGRKLEHIFSLDNTLRLFRRFILKNVFNYTKFLNYCLGNYR